MTLRSANTSRLIVPLISVAILVAAGFFGRFGRAAELVGSTAYFEAVSNSMSALPYRVGNWVGRDIDASNDEAERLLQTNEITQRRYQNVVTGQSVTVLVVHCLDIRNLLGHHPPVCYPAHGWEMTDDESCAIQIQDSTHDARRYQFRRWNNERLDRIDVVSFFAAPSENILTLPDMQSLRKHAEVRLRGGLGAAGFQVILDGQPGTRVDLDEVQDLLHALQPVLQTITTFEVGAGS